MALKDVQVISVDNPRGGSRTCTYPEVSECPICHCRIVPVPVTGSYKQLGPLLNSVTRFDVSIIFLCPNCQDTFLVKYKADISGNYLTASSLQGQWPLYPKSAEISDAIKTMSPLFATTYAEATQAEAENLTEIAGCGYRKAVEYLVKDYLCTKFPDQSDSIKGEFLGTAIKRIEDDRIKTLAERTVWIGNDETHYVRKHENLDIEDMKRFITAMLHYIDAELALEEALSIEPVK